MIKMDYAWVSITHQLYGWFQHLLAYCFDFTVHNLTVLALCAVLSEKVRQIHSAPDSRQNQLETNWLALSSLRDVFSGFSGNKTRVNREVSIEITTSNDCYRYYVTVESVKMQLFTHTWL